MSDPVKQWCGEDALHTNEWARVIVADIVSECQKQGLSYAHFGMLLQALNMVAAQYIGTSMKGGPTAPDFFKAMADEVLAGLRR